MRGGSVGVSLSQTFQERRDQFHVLRLGEYLGPLNPAASDFLARAQAFFVQQTGDPVASRQLAVLQLENLRQQQASSLAFFDTFWMAAVLTFVVTFAVLFMKRSVAEKGAHVGSERSASGRRAPIDVSPPFAPVRYATDRGGASPGDR